jgi:hypothetical protein
LLDRVEPLDWFFTGQKALVVLVAVFAFGYLLTIPVSRRPWSLRRLVVPPMLAVGLLHGLPMAIGAMAATDDRLDPEVLVDRYSAVDPAFRLAADSLIERPGPDIDFYRELLQSSAKSLEPQPQSPPRNFAPLTRSRAPLPHVFMFVIDGLRRDYLSPYNQAVQFTPAIGTWASSSFVFTNAFTKYGGTLLAMPSLWAGGEVTRAWGRSAFARINAIERLMVANRYHFVINDHTVAGHLDKSTVRTFLDPEVKSVDTDICSLVDGLQRHLSARTDAQPVFAFLSPMNVHTLNLRRSTGVPAGRRDGGFYEPYATAVRRVDSCFGTFIAYLKEAGLYDNSAIVLTTDHGESLGEDGNWGHQFWLFPEDIRIPLIMHVPRAWRANVTTDLSRVTFSTDIAPTLYQLLGYDVRDLGSLFGIPLFASRHEEPRQRRRESFLLVSSYGASYGLLRRNGKFLYISDLVNMREYGFELFTDPLGTRVRVSDDVRRVSQMLIRERVRAFDAFHFDID